MAESDIEDIRRGKIEEIKEKVRKNPKFLHPANKERLEYQEKLKFKNGYEFTCWLQKIGIMKNPTDLMRDEREKSYSNAECKNEREYRCRCVKRRGFEDNKEYNRIRKKEWAHETGRYLSKEFNEDCSLWFGEFIAQNYVMKTFEDPVSMPSNNPGFDWSCKKGEKIDHKASCLRYHNKSPNWEFEIDYNNIADWFILSAWDNRESLTPLHVWIFHKNDIIGGKKFWRRHNLSITNTPKCLTEFRRYEANDRLDRLKELCKRKS